MAEGSFVGGAGCVECEGEYVPEPGSAKLCPACRDLRHPPILLNRGSKWSPLALGWLSLVCDVLMIPTVLAIVRGVGELREVGRREAAGLYREEHAVVRTGAVWGIVLGAVRPGVLVFAVIVGVMATLMAPVEEAREPFWTDVDELEELIARMHVPGESDAAMDDFEVYARTMTPEEVERSIVEAERGFPGDSWGPMWSRSAIIVRLVASGVDVPLARVRPLYPQLNSYGGDAVRQLALRPGDRAGLEAWLELIRLRTGDGVDSGLDVERLLELREFAPLYLPTLLAAGRRTPQRSAGRAVAHGICSSSRGSGQLDELEEPLLENHTHALDQLRYVSSLPQSSASVPLAYSLESARTSLAVLGCVEGEAVRPALREALRNREPQIAVGAADAMLRRGERVSDADVRRLAAALGSRAPLYDALLREGQLDRMPARYRAPEMLDESRSFRLLPSLGGSERVQ